MMSGALQPPSSPKHDVATKVTTKSQPDTTTTNANRSSVSRDTEEDVRKTHNMPPVYTHNPPAYQADKSSPDEDDQRSEGSMLSHDPDDSDAEPDWL